MVVSEVHAIGIAPARTNLEFKQGEQEGAIRIIAEETPLKIVLTKEGELGKYIELEKESMILEDSETWVKFKIILPEDLPPGERAGGILVLQIPKDSLQENVVLAAPAVVHQIRVNVPFPGKYLTGKMFITNINLNEPILFTLAVKNFGKDKIQNAKASIVIKGPTNEEIAVLSTDSVSVDSGQEKQLTAYWQTENSGSYIADATIEYDGKIIKLSEKLDVGNLELEIERIEVNNFKIGQIAKLDIYLRNKWNQPLKADGRVEIFKNNNLVSTFNTIPVDVLEGSTSTMNAYWNTEGIDIGEYDISVKINYNGKTSEKTFTSYVSADNINFKNFASGKAISQKGGGSTSLLITGIFVLIILNVFLFIYINKRLKNRPPQQ